MLRSLIGIVIVSLIGGCVTSGEHLSLKNDVNQLKRDYYAHDRDIALIKKDFGTVRNASKKSVGIDSFDAIRESQEQMSLQLSSFSKEIQQMRAAVDESRYRADRSLGEHAEALEVIHLRLDKIENDINAMNAVLIGRKPPEEKVEERADVDKIPMGPKALYEDAHKHFKKGNYKKARQGFKGFLKEYPDHELADNSQFWIGETYYREKEFRDAIIEYQELRKVYPDSPKIPSALYKQGLAFQEIGEENSAKIVFELIVKKYPKSPEADRAKKKLQSQTKKKK